MSNAMIHHTRGDILSADAEALVNTVNCVGVMGRGIALQFKRAYPEAFDEYEAACHRKEVRPGAMLVWHSNRLGNPRLIIHFPTKRHWRGSSRIEDIDSGLRALVEVVRSEGIRSIAVPPLGCGLGGLSWGQVRPVIERALAPLKDVRVILYEPGGAPKAQEAHPLPQTAKPLTLGRASLLGLVRRYLEAAMTPTVTLLELHKLVYFMQAAGEPLRLRFVKARYGPYADNLRHVLNALEGHHIRGYGDAEDRPDKPIEVLPGAWEEAAEVLAGHASTSRHFDRVVRLIEGFESPFGMELLTTVHWVATQEQATTPEFAIARTHAWSTRKRMFSETQIRKAWQALDSRGWLDPSKQTEAQSG